MIEHQLSYLLCRFESQRKVVLFVLGFQLVEIESVRIEVMDEGAKGQSVVPARAEILYLHILHAYIYQLNQRSDYVQIQI